MVSSTVNGMAQVELSRAKNLDYTPDVTLDAYWETNHIAAVRITNLGKDAEGNGTMTYRVVKEISEGPMDQSRTVKLSYLWFGMNVDKPPLLAVNDDIVIYYAKAGSSPIVVSKVDTVSNNSGLVGNLLRIASLRRNEGGSQALSESVFYHDNSVALYSLKRLLNYPSFQGKSDYVARLITLRNMEERDARVRSLAARLAFKLQGKADASDEEYVWLRDAIAQSTRQEWTQLRVFVDRLLEFERKRADNVAFLVRIVKDPNARQDVRIAGYSSFEDPRLFHFVRPDAESDKIFDTCIAMLSDRDPMIIVAGAALLHNISGRIDSAVKPGYVERAKTAVRSATAVQKNDQVRGQLENYLRLLSL